MTPGARSTPGLPERIVCLSAETPEILWRLGEGHRVVGISGFTRRPAELRHLPKVSAFSTADLEAVAALRPDLVLAYSDLQADLVAGLIRRGIDVLATCQTSLDGIARTIRMIGGLVGRAAEAEELAAEFLSAPALQEPSPNHHPAAGTGADLRRPRVYFEEWGEPLISGITWVSELIERAGGEDCFPELRGRFKAADRVVDPAEVLRRSPEIILASWCGKPADLSAIARRPGWAHLPAVQRGFVRELPSDIVLQPGLALVDGFRAIAAVVEEWRRARFAMREEGP